MDLLGRRQPSLWRISLTQVANATTAEVVGPSTRVVQNGRRGGAVGEKSDAGWFYELQLVHALPIVDISRTPLSAMLPPATYGQAIRWMHHVKPALV